MGSDRVNVPVSYIDGYSDNENLTKNREYRVFWSPTEGDTPKKFIKREKKKLYLEGRRLVAGWYPATFLLLKGKGVDPVSKFK